MRTALDEGSVIGRLRCVSLPISCISSLCARDLRRRCLEWAHLRFTTQGSTRMVTFFFAFVTVAFFGAIVLNVVEGVGSARAFG